MTYVPRPFVVVLQRRSEVVERREADVREPEREREHNCSMGGALATQLPPASCEVPRALSQKAVYDPVVPLDPLRTVGVCAATAAEPPAAEGNGDIISCAVQHAEGYAQTLLLRTH